MEELKNDIVTEKFYNIEEQRQWNDKNMWDVDGHEWSIPFESSDKLWNDYIYDYVKELKNSTPKKCAIKCSREITKEYI